ncbi:hypothetical protein T265_15649, partial [Opisthorchis viverrini]
MFEVIAGAELTLNDFERLPPECCQPSPSLPRFHGTGHIAPPSQAFRMHTLSLTPADKTGKPNAREHQGINLYGFPSPHISKLSSHSFIFHKISKTII